MSAAKHSAQATTVSRELGSLPTWKIMSLKGVWTIQEWTKFPFSINWWLLRQRYRKKTWWACIGPVIVTLILQKWTVVFPFFWMILLMIFFPRGIEFKWSYMKFNSDIAIKLSTSTLTTWSRRNAWSKRDHCLFFWMNRKLWLIQPASQNWESKNQNTGFRF